MESRFATTRWSQVLAAADPSAPEARAALGALCESYWYPLYAFARRRGRREEDARDLVQGFFARLIEKEVLGVADPNRGRFRAFLRASFRNYVTNEHRRETAAKRGGGATPISFDAAGAESRYRLEPGHAETPERAFDRIWALEVLERALRRLRSAYEARRKSDQFEALKGCLDGSSDVSHAERAEAMDLSVGAVKVAVHRLRQRYRQALRDEIAQTLDEGEVVEDELAALFAALA